MTPEYVISVGREAMHGSMVWSATSNPACGTLLLPCTGKSRVVTPRPRHSPTPGNIESASSRWPILPGTCTGWDAAGAGLAA